MGNYYYDELQTNLYEVIPDKESSFTEFRDECDHISTMITWEKDYGSPEFNPFATPEEFLEAKLKVCCSGGDLLHAISSGLVYGLRINQEDPENVFVESLKDDFEFHIGDEAQYQKIVTGAEDLSGFEFDALCHEMVECDGAFDKILQSDMLILPIYVHEASDVTEYSTKPWLMEKCEKCGYIYVDDFLPSMNKDRLYQFMETKVDQYNAWVQELSAEVYIYNLSEEDWKNHREVGFVFDSDNFVDNLPDRIQSLGEYENLRACLDDNLGIFPTDISREEYVTGRFKEELKLLLDNFNLDCDDFTIKNVAKDLVAGLRITGKEDIEL